ncbi:transglycosylase domain-containing protein [Rhodococcus sp. YH1]|uniref:transglycosylase domain-containing protein n=1 Tax=Rhodococcus sp. YH1 TaxID=89066 RepID=UPI001A0AABEB|nr:Monofunctional biosynthetic peptidoglycan transglycosylase [Rhodococcus sp. YH1]NCL78610.1 Monofunctional biosynthetic peptidoglycan transglycosylase [Rhodococcus sp. YH1]
MSQPVVQDPPREPLSPSTPDIPYPPTGQRSRLPLPRQGKFWRAVRKAATYALKALLIFFIVISIIAGFYRYVAPPRTTFMLSDEAPGETVYEYVPLEYISRYYVAGVLFHEDTELGHRVGPFHVGDFIERIEAFLDDIPDNDPHGSSIPQQLVKNIFMIRGDSTFVQASRKGVEAVLSYPFNLILGDKRQLELYLNYAQFGPNLYGICAASWYYFNRPPWDGSVKTAAWIAGLLPAGEDAIRAQGGGIDTNINFVDIDLLETIWRAHAVIPYSFEYMGGWENMTATVGITDSASDNYPSIHEDSCSTMPESVARRLAAEGARWSTEYE